VNYGSGGSRFSEVELADYGGAASIDSEFAKNGVPTGTNLFRAPEVHLEIPWGTAADIWSFGVTVSLPLATQFSLSKLIFTQLINLIWGLNFHIFEPEEPESHEIYETKIVVHQHQWFGPFPISYKEIADEDTRSDYWHHVCGAS
jgi:serine/threonine protein kinase